MVLRAKRAVLPMHELDRETVGRRYARVGPYAPGGGVAASVVRSLTLDLTPLRLSHAVIKADFTKEPALAWAASLGFFFQQLAILSWNKGELRLQPDLIDACADFFGTSLAGRIGQGVALLMMEERGCHYVAHFERRHGEQGPDFIMESRTGRALVEAKGMFARPNTNSQVKRVLRGGLQQLEVPEDQRRGADKSFCIATVLREVGDPHLEPSMVAFVDPNQEGQGTQDPAWVVRENYGGWLRAMGQFSSAARLAYPDLGGDDAPLSPFRFRGADYEVALLGLVPFGAEWGAPIEGVQCLVAGLPSRLLGVLAKTSSISSEGAEDVLRDLPRQSVVVEEGVSVFADGSLLALVPATDFFCKALGSAPNHESSGRPRA